MSAEFSRVVRLTFERREHIPETLREIERRGFVWIWVSKDALEVSRDPDMPSGRYESHLRAFLGWARQVFRAG